MKDIINKIRHLYNEKELDYGRYHNDINEGVLIGIAYVIKLLEGQPQAPTAEELLESLPEGTYVGLFSPGAKYTKYIAFNNNYNKQGFGNSPVEALLSFKDKNICG